MTCSIFVLFLSSQNKQGKCSCLGNLVPDGRTHLRERGCKNVGWIELAHFCDDDGGSPGSITPDNLC